MWIIVVVVKKNFKVKPKLARQVFSILYFFEREKIERFVDDLP